ncbi:MAG: type II toxin-antitoxin system VapC family toxin, partial [Phycisphaerae bacterium]|nr:type II toxin-antitoxin system VapC family toxin [Phycisphaerae bacterium]
YLDSSALVKRYIAESGSIWLADVVAPESGNAIHISVIAGAEVVAAFARRQRAGGLTAEEVARAVYEFQDDWANQFEVVGIDRALIGEAMILARRHSLRGYDSVQLASAMELRELAQAEGTPIRLLSADDELNAAAIAEGLAVENPNLHP